MASGLLSLKWNNHRSTFFHVLSSIRSKESYCDATLACDGRFYPVHKLVLSTCSEYFEQIFERTQCKHPVIVLKDIKCDDLEALMNYMYVGEVNVLQEKLAGLIKAAECLKIKGLAVPDEDPVVNKETRRNQMRGEVESSPHAKRRRRDDSSLYEDRERNASRNIRLSQRDHHQLARLESAQEAHTSSTEGKQSQGLSNSFQKTNVNQSGGESETDINLQEEENEQSGHEVKLRRSSDESSQRLPSLKAITEVSINETSVKTEPPDVEDGEEVVDSKEALHTDLGFDPSGDGDSLGADGIAGSSNSNEAGFSDSNIMDSTPQTVEDVVAQAIPTSSNFQGNSFPIWEGEGSLQNFPVEGFSGENSQGRQMNALNPTSSSFLLSCTKKDSSRRDENDSPKVPFSFHSTFGKLPTRNQKESYVTHPPPHNGNDLFKSSSLIEQQKKNLKKSFVCSVCKVHCKSIISLRTHIQIHNHIKQYNCPNCSYQTFRKHDLSYHFRTHTGEKPYTCPFCPHKSSVMSNMKTHVRRRHSNSYQINPTI